MEAIRKESTDGKKEKKGQKLNIYSAIKKKKKTFQVSMIFF